MNDEYWIKDDSKKSDEIILNLKDPYLWWKAFIKWDGCLEITKYFNQPADTSDELADFDRFHICDLDEFINRLTDLRDKARAHFNNEEWNENI